MFSLVFLRFSRCLSVAYDYHSFGMIFICRRHGTIFIYVRVIQMNKVYMINDNKSNKRSSIYYITIIICILVSNVYVQLSIV